MMERTSFSAGTMPRFSLKKPRARWPYLAVACLLFVTAACDREPYPQGKNLYAVHCANCHMADGTGLGGNIPPLAGADYLRDRQEMIACLIRHGSMDTVTVNGTVYDAPMPGVPRLSEFQIANIINYVNHAWGNDYGFVTVEPIRRRLENCK